MSVLVGVFDPSARRLEASIDAMERLGGRALERHALHPQLVVAGIGLRVFTRGHLSLVAIDAPGRAIDADLVLDAHQRSGPSGLFAAAGAGAFLLFDGQRGFLASDRVGARLFTAEEGERWIGATSLSLAQAGRRAAPTVLPRAVVRTLAAGGPIGAETWIDGVRALLPGRIVAFGAGPPRELTYAWPRRRRPSGEVRPEEYADGLGRALLAIGLDPAPVWFDGSLAAALLVAAQRRARGDARPLVTRAGRARIDRLGLQPGEWTEVPELPLGEALARVVGLEDGEPGPWIGGHGEGLESVEVLTPCGGSRRLELEEANDPLAPERRALLAGLVHDALATQAVEELRGELERTAAGMPDDERAARYLALERPSVPVTLEAVARAPYREARLADLVAWWPGGGARAIVERTIERDFPELSGWPRGPADDLAGALRSAPEVGRELEDYARSPGFLAAVFDRTGFHQRVARFFGGAGGRAEAELVLQLARIARAHVGLVIAPLDRPPPAARGAIP